ncbi:hypothetical protein RirG_013320 [Rhizophagus irregularis DAOM 197198w]|uniref:Uncharacterized protein n=1 Tax=Rhizophagus irregularis (strain DAOM 197198w) TaxID=1432141 RepID=A0A015KA74_RHIIW|nr:hypothetical protein RirG_013320 [Rhizophagus irregularis DAOM 197198w]
MGFLHGRDMEHVLKVGGRMGVHRDIDEVFRVFHVVEGDDDAIRHDPDIHLNHNY